MTESVLYVVATPIGNLDDLSPRARDVLKEVDLIAAEDTRHTARLLAHFGIETKQIALHEHNEDDVSARLVDSLLEGRAIALVSDAGTPLLSDPGFPLVRAAHAAGIRVSPVPGPSALIAALSVSGLPTDRFCYEGFLPSKRGRRKAKLQELARESRTLVLFESVHRIAACIDDMIEVLGPERQAFIGRELTKLHEQCSLAPLKDLREDLAGDQITAKGEFVLIVEGSGDEETDEVTVDPRHLLVELARVMPDSQAVQVAAAVTGRRQNELYRLMLEAQEGKQ